MKSVISMNRINAVADLHQSPLTPTMFAKRGELRNGGDAPGLVFATGEQFTVRCSYA
jgi:hypothetical protein